MAEGCQAVFGRAFDKKFKACYKKHSGCFENDFSDVQKTILANLENTRNTERISNLGQECRSNPVYKTRMIVTELRSPSARVVWHFCKERNQILFIDIYLKSQQENHDKELIVAELNSYYLGK